MATDLEKVESIYSRLYEISLQIGELTAKEMYSELVTYLSKKERLLNEAGSLIQNLQNKDINTDKLKEIAEKYQKQEKENIKALSKVKNEIKKELSQTTKDKKLLNAYGSDKEYVHGSILDFRE